MEKSESIFVRLLNWRNLNAPIMRERHREERAESLKYLLRLIIILVNILCKIDNEFNGMN